MLPGKLPGGVRDAAPRCQGQCISCTLRGQGALFLRSQDESFKIITILFAENLQEQKVTSLQV